MSDENPYAPPEANIEVEPSTESDLASRWARLGGSLIDGLIGLTIVLPTMYFLGFFERVMNQQQSLSDSLVIAVVWIVTFFIINSYLLATRGQTVGKKLAGTRIVSATDGRILPFWKVATVRFLPFYLVGYIPLIGSLLSLINILFIYRKDRRCVHDLIANSRVVVAN